MELTFRKRGTEITFSPNGHMLGPDALKLGESFAKALDLGSGLRSARVHLSDLAEIDNAAVDAIVDWHGRYGEQGVALRIAGVGADLRERLVAAFRARGVFDFARVFECDDDGDGPPIVV